MNEYQSKLLGIAAWFHSFCLEHQLRYFMLGGTQLGAVRHNGFIPWDDDIDVGMPRADYEKFLDFTQGKKYGHYIVESLRDEAPDWIYTFAKVYDTTTTYTEKTRIPVHRGIYLDVFPLDGFGISLREAKLRYIPIHIAELFLIFRTIYKNPHYSWWKQVLIILFNNSLVEYIFDTHSLISFIDNSCRKLKYDVSTFVGNMTTPVYGSNKLDFRTNFGTPKLYKFENIELFGVEDAHAYLSNLFGDYMTPPPIEEQVSHHGNFYYDLHHGYID